MKGLFIDEPHVHGADWQAVDLGRGLAEGETLRLVETAAAQSPEFEPEDGASLAQTLRSAITELVGLVLWLAAIATEAFWLIGVAALIVTWAVFNLLRPQ